MNKSIDTDYDSNTPHPAALNLEEAINRMGDRELYLEIARYFAARLELMLADLGTALEKKDMGEATRLAHSFKGNCATVGADALCGACLTLELLCREADRDAASALYTALAPRFLELRDLLQTL